MAYLGHQSLPPTDLGRVDEEMASPGGRLSHTSNSRQKIAEDIMRWTRRAPSQKWCSSAASVRVVGRSMCAGQVELVEVWKVIGIKMKKYYHLRSVLTYACETWSMSGTDENTISMYERKISFLEEFKEMARGEEDQS
ncbi:hypothetical protein TNCV_2888931 [Trichonephila clavipes]|nr:hypothetical protein TNCV_2888931 [Trichonephila clavipes]